MEQNNIIINNLKYPKKTKFYDLARVPKKVGGFIRFLERIIISIMAKGQERSVVKINMESIGPNDNCLTLCNHMQFLDFIVAIDATLPRSVHYPMSIEALSIMPYRLLEAGGVLCKRKFNSDIALVRTFIRLVKANQLVGIFPEARYSVTGELAVLPDSTGKICKSLGIPVVVMLFHGHYLVNPTWGNGKKRKLPIVCEQKLILTKEQVESLSLNEINAIIRQEMYYSEWEYQKQNNILIKEDFRAEGIDKILYKCPHCQTEMQMTSHGSTIKCEHCKVEYFYHEDSSLTCLNDKTIFNDVPSWLNWERAEVRKEIINGTYYYEERLPAYAYPHPKNIFNLHEVLVIHDLNGFKAEGSFNGADFRYLKTPQQNYSLQTEFASPTFKKKSVFGFSTNNNTIFFVPKNPSVIQKLYFAVEELYQITQ
ncbi:MAG: 1-acyl-sn-glycerol-3-phosphate acyltransferase [Acholeplasmatales bacterium]|jgi:1-acyl-sn-glycerol-3-phosphate acyltransferase/DNA-directed RNA polymerase subunit RPC12/RpoP|nr:1-acyl-sn-glycerol-3-phosphate acyltransferase [Acholeplasmatales bacterium]